MTRRARVLVVFTLTAMFLVGGQAAHADSLCVGARVDHQRAQLCIPIP